MSRPMAACSIAGPGSRRRDGSPSRRGFFAARGFRPRAFRHGLGYSAGATRPPGGIRRTCKMPALDTALIVLGGIALFAAFVNGAIGYGFSSLTVPLALVFYTNRILNPAVVLIEVFLNLYVLFINRDGIPAVWRRVWPILIGLLPGIAIGAYVLALLQPGW